MWYFSWVLGLGLACTIAILNAMWFEMKEDERKKKSKKIEIFHCKGLHICGLKIDL